jgi:proteasome lid subunit RPN8/RPN11
MKPPPWTCPKKLWEALLAELARRGNGEHECGAFLLGIDRNISQIVYYDNLAPGCLDSGVVVFPGSGYTPLWDYCAANGLRVIADIHTHPWGPHQSLLDRQNPMIAQHGHLALIVPDFALRPVPISEVGIYAYIGNHQWLNLSGPGAPEIFHLQDLP